jgi:ADP-ribose pyrophosphatase
MPDPIARVRPNRTRPGIPALDRVVDEMIRADATFGQEVVERNVVYAGRILTAERDVARTASGELVTRDVVIHPGAVVVAPLDEQGRILMVTQYRLPAGGTLLELPAGTLDVHDGSVEDPLAAAHRELEEETGFRAGRMERIGGYWSAPGFSTEYLTLFLATDLRAAGADRLEPDADEELGLVALPLAEAVAAVDAGLIEDAKSIAGILLVARRIGAA